MSTHRWVAQQSVARYPTAKRLATEYTLRSRGSGVRSVPSRAAGEEEQAEMTSHGTTLVSKATPVKTVTGQQATVPLVRLRVYKRN
jgi:hypothetical protein